jgi:hypothetical protein
VITAGEEAVSARTIEGGAAVWRLPDERLDGGNSLLAVAGSAVFVRQGEDLLAVDGTNGRLTWAGSLRGADGSIVAGSGVLVVARREAGIAVLGPAGKRPPPRVQLTPRQSVVEYGSSQPLEAVVGSFPLFHAMPVGLRADRFPLGRFGRARRIPVDVTGEAFVRVRPSRLTAYRAEGQRGRSRPTVVFVVPRIRVREVGGGSASALVRVGVRMPRRVRGRGRVLAIYVGRRGRYERLGAGRLRGGRGRYAATFSVRRPSGSSRVFVCVRGLLRHGLGVGSVVDRRCGAARISRGAARAATASRGTRWPRAMR